MTAVRTRLSRAVMARLRLASQGLVGPGFGSVPEAVRSMAAMQAHACEQNPAYRLSGPILPLTGEGAAARLGPQNSPYNGTR